jgi:hypothetical protein
VNRMFTTTTTTNNKVDCDKQQWVQLSGRRLWACLVTCIHCSQALRIDSVWFLVGGWDLSHAVQDSLVSQAELIRPQCSFLRGQACASATSMQMGHVSETSDACVQRTKRTARLCDYGNQTPPCACAWPGCLQPGCLDTAWLISELNQTRP